MGIILIFTTENTEGTEGKLFLCALCVLCGFKLTVVKTNK